MYDFLEAGTPGKHVPPEELEVLDDILRLYNMSLGQI
jgi:hypothetical protein